MTTLVFLIEQIAVGLYILVGVGMLIVFRWWIGLRRELRATQFELERDIYRYRIANAFTLFIILAELGLVVLGVQQVVAPTIRHSSDITVSINQVVEDGFAPSPTPAPVQFGNSPIDASGVQIGEQDIVQVVATPTLELRPPLEQFCQIRRQFPVAIRLMQPCKFRQMGCWYLSQ